MIPAVILAGGKARRMDGRDKGLLPLGGRTILDHVLERLAPQSAPIALNANGDPARFDAYELPVLADPVPDHPGPLAGVLAGMLWARASGAEFVVVVAADTPFLPADMVETFQRAQAAADLPVVLAEAPDGRHPTFGLWATSLAEPLADALGQDQRRVVTFADARGSTTAHFADTPFNPFFNVNTPEDLAEAEAIYRTHVA